ncbi:MAG: arsenosugar biosynthesis radical SAM (seleno)protein ArsS [Planktothrix sp.]|uniref:arsenosugar biosynthesis radical SAM (seleno)protein ArsS n=1 Tax=Planktothrix sp. TaxID=3088171 RepID=UPI0038D37024
MIPVTLTSFDQKLGFPLTKQPITILQINLGKRCNLTCNHCHVEAGPKRTEELNHELTLELIELISRFPQIQTVDLTGGAPEMNYGFKPLVEAARSTGKQVIVRSNLTVYFVPGYQEIPEYCAHHQLRIIASLPCYLENNVEQMRGKGVYQDSIQAIQWLNRLGYGHTPELILDLVYNPSLPTTEKFNLPPEQSQLELAYKQYLKQQFDIDFNQLLTITNIPIGRTKFYLQHKKLENSYLEFLESNYNPNTITQLMCRNQLSIDYQGYIYDCDFNQMENLPARSASGKILTVSDLLAKNNLDLIETVQTASYCYGCTAGCGSSCGGSLI